MEYLRRQTLGIMVHFADLEKHSRLIGRSPRSRTWNSHFNNCFNWRLSRIDIQGLKAFDVDNDSNIQNISIARLKTNFHAFHCNFGKNSSEYGTKNIMDHARNLIMVFYVPMEKLCIMQFGIRQPFESLFEFRIPKSIFWEK